MEEHSSYALPQALGQLAALDEVQVKQMATPLFTGNKYVISTTAGQELFTAKEDGRQNGGSKRDFVMPVYDSHGLEMMRLRRRFLCRGSTVSVMMQGAVAAVVQEEVTWWCLLLTINDDADQPHYRIKSVPFRNRGEFQLQTADKRTIGVVRKESRGFWTAAFSWLNDYTLTFPADMELRFKAGVIGACILLDFMLFEGK